MAKLPGTALTDLLGAARAARVGPGEAARAAPDATDCSVIQTTAGLRLLTCDFGPFIGAEPYRAGRIAAFHALSDVYAMGGQPVAALDLIIVNPELPKQAFIEVLEGLLSACDEEHVPLVGGQTIVGREASVGMFVYAEPDPAGRLLTKAGARPGDVLMVSKQLGVGLLQRAYSLQVVGDEALDVAIDAMDRSSARAAECLKAVDAHACTDVTGFGLLGHLAEMLVQSTCGATVDAASVPLLPGVRELPETVTDVAWLDENSSYVEALLLTRGVRANVKCRPLLDPQTNGGLLVAVAESGVEALARGGFTRIGSVTATSLLEVI